MKKLVFDSGPIISLSINNLLWLLEPLKRIGNAKFYLTESVKKEIVDIPLTKSKKYKFEALQVLHFIENGTFNVVKDHQIRKDTTKLIELANNCYSAFGHNIKIVHQAEMSALALCLQEQADALIVDERTARLLIENRNRLLNILRHSLHTNVTENKNNIRELKKLVRKVRVIRSIELVTLAFEKGLLDRYLANISNPKKTLLEGVLWGIKLSGCSVSKNELDQIIRLES